MLIDVHSHYMPRALARALEKREAAPRIIHQDGKSHIEYGQGSATPLLPVFVEPDLILEGMDKAGIDHSLLSVTIPGVDWLADGEAEEVGRHAALRGHLQCPPGAAAFHFFPPIGRIGRRAAGVT